MDEFALPTHSSPCCDNKGVMSNAVAAGLLSSVVHDGAVLCLTDAQILMQALLGGSFDEPQMATLLTALHRRGVTAAELAGFASAMRGASVPLPLTDAEREALVDTCGTGGDASGTFNISTAVALVAAAAGVNVAKHGNRSVTSRCGSADVLEAMGIPIDLDPKAAAQALREHGFVFLLATRLHPATRLVAPVRRLLPFRTVFNLLGPMTNPAGALRQVMGVYAADAVPLAAEAFALGAHMRAAMVVHGDGAAGGLDELSLSATSSVAHVSGGDWRVEQVVPEDAGVTRSDDPLRGGDAVENAAILNALFAGERGARRDCVVLNAAAVLQVAGVANDLRQGRAEAERVIDAGHVTRLVNALRRSM